MLNGGADNETLIGGLGDDLIAIDGGGTKRIVDEGGTETIVISGVSFNQVRLRLGSLLIDIDSQRRFRSE